MGGADMGDADMGDADVGDMINQETIIRQELVRWRSCKLDLIGISTNQPKEISFQKKSVVTVEKKSK